MTMDGNGAGSMSYGLARNPDNPASRAVKSVPASPTTTAAARPPGEE
jgi:hypothetical protein